MKFPANWTFWRSAPTARALPRPSQLPTAQAAIFVGRSNAGKSSALNALVGARVARVARASRGRTRAANFFASGDSLLIDLPGYGYARAPKSDRVNWPALASACLRVPAARGLVVVVDIRRNVGAFDLDVLRLAAEAALPVLILLAKADKEGLGARLAAARQARKIIDEVAAASAPPAVDIILFSARKKIGVAAAKKARRRVAAARVRRGAKSVDGAGGGGRQFARARQHAPDIIGETPPRLNLENRLAVAVGGAKQHYRRAAKARLRAGIDGEVVQIERAAVRESGADMRPARADERVII